MVFERQAEHERLRDRLNAEQLLAVADVEHLAVDGDDGDAEPVRVGQGQLGDVVGDLAVVHIAVFRIDCLQRVAKRRDGRLQAADEIVECTGRLIVGHGG